MRQIKFRAWAIGTMLYSGKDFNSIPVVDMPLATKGGGMACNFELMQFTGLHDKHGAEIYEGDIVESTGFKYACKHNEHRAEFAWYFGGQYIYPIGDMREGLKVIGNIYENSDLLDDSEVTA